MATSPRPSLASSIVSTYSSDEEDVPPRALAPVTPPPAPPGSSTTTVTVGKIEMPKDAEMPAVLNGNLVKTDVKVFISRSGDGGPVDVNEFVTDAVKINSQSAKTFIPSRHDSSTKLNGSKEDVEGLSRRWYYLISAVFALAVVTLIATAVLSVTSWRTSQGPVPALDPATKATVNALSEEEKKFASIPSGPTVVTRATWLAAPPTEPLDLNTLPASTVIVYHSATASCNSLPECIEATRVIQKFHQESRGWADVGYNFLVGGDGSVYWGRGFDFVGAHTKGHNNGSVGIAFIGTYTEVVPNRSQVEAFHKLVAVGVQDGKVASDYSLVAACQLTVTAAPGLALVRQMASWPHYNSSLSLTCTDG